MENVAMLDEKEVFSLSYAQARAKFRQAAQAAGLHVASYPLALPGRDGEALAVDAAWQGARNAAKLLLLTRACMAWRVMAARALKPRCCRTAPGCRAIASKVF